MPEGQTLGAGQAVHRVRGLPCEAMGDEGGPGPRDAILVERVLDEDPTAFAELFERHAPAVRRVAAAYVRRPEIVADVVQETFAKAYEKIRDLRNPDRFRPWLLSIARHSAVDHGRSSMRDRQLDPDAGEQIPDSDPTPQQLHELAELARQVSDKIAGLSQRDSMAISMVTYLGFGPADVAAALGISTGAAKVVVHRARRRLRTSIGLEVLQQQPDLACDSMRPLLTDPAESLRHFESCPDCLGTVTEEVTAFDANRPARGPAVPNERDVRVQVPRPEGPPR